MASVFRSATALLAACVVLAGASPRQATRTVYVTVAGEHDAAVPNLSAADFEIKEEGKARKVVEAALPDAQVSIALLIDDKGSDINEIRSALVTFFGQVQGRAELSLTTVVPSVARVFDYTSSMPTMLAGVQRLVWRSGPATGLLLGAVADAADELKRREATRPAIVVVTFEGDEFRSHRPAPAVLQALERSHAALHVVAIGKPTLRKMNRALVESGDAQGDEWTVDQNNRNAVLGEGPRASGGRRHEITVATGLSKALESVARDLLNQYAVVYEAGADSKATRKLSVTVKRRGVTVRAPTRIAG